MHPLTEEVPKALLNIGGKTLVDWAIERLVKSGIDKIVVAVGWKGSMIQNHLTTSTDTEIRIVDVADYEIGPLQTLATAIETFDDDFLLTPVDTLIDSSALTGMISHYSTKSSPMVLAVDFSSTSGTLVSTTKNGVITGLGTDSLDTHTTGRSAMLFLGHSKLAEDCRNALASGETKFVSLLEQMIQNGHSLRYYPINSRCIDIDTLHDVLSANQSVLQEGKISQSGHVFVPQGDRIEIGDNLVLNSHITLQRGTEIIGPVLISQRCNIGENCRIGPNSTIGFNSTLLAGCEITNAIVFGESKVSAQSRLRDLIVYKSTNYRVE